MRMDEDRIAALPEEDFGTSLLGAIVAHKTDDWRLDSIVTSGEIMRGQTLQWAFLHATSGREYRLR